MIKYLTSVTKKHFLNTLKQQEIDRELLLKNTKNTKKWLVTLYESDDDDEDVNEANEMNKAEFNGGSSGFSGPELQSVSPTPGNKNRIKLSGKISQKTDRRIGDGISLIDATSLCLWDDAMDLLHDQLVHQDLTLEEIEGWSIL